MMVDTVGLQQQIDALRQAARQMTELQNRVARVGSRLPAERTVERFRPAIQAQAGKIECLSADMYSLERSLEQIVESYEVCEERIVDNAEGYATLRRSAGVIHFPIRPHRPRGWIDPTPWNPRPPRIGPYPHPPIRIIVPGWIRIIFPWAPMPYIRVRFHGKPAWRFLVTLY